KYKQYHKPFHERRVVLIKGYESKLGRCNVILEAILQQKEILKSLEVRVFAANDKVKKFISESGLATWNNFYYSEVITQEEVLQLMGKSLIYIGNSISDGMPNTLLEAIIMGAFPIQSNPGGATAEIIENGAN